MSMQESNATIPIIQQAGSEHSLTPILDGTHSSNPLDNKLSKQRWFILFALSVFGLSIAIVYDTSPILHLMLKLLDLRIDKYLYIGQISGHVMAIIAIPTAWFVDKYGIRAALLTATAMFVINGFIKALLYSPEFPGWSEHKIFYWVLSTMLGTEITAIYFLLPLKVSETWFAESERSFAWTFAVSQFEIGIGITSFLYPKVMTEVKDVKILAIINIIFVLITAIICLICVTQSVPKHAPNRRVAKAALEETSFKSAILRMIKHRSILIHLIHLAIIESVLLSVSVALQDIFTSVGHSEVFAGDFKSIMAISGLVFQVMLAYFIHRVKDSIFTCKLGSFMQVVLFLFYLITVILGAPGWAVIAVGLIFNLSKSWAVLNFINITAQLASGVVPQATIIGFQITLSVITRIIVQTTFVSLISIAGKQSFYRRALLFAAIVALINDAIYLILFKGNSRKDSETEEEESSNQI